MNTHFHTLIVGGGLSGLVVAHKLRLRRPGLSFAVLEKSRRTGGVITTHRDKGYLSEIGPHGFLDNCAESRAILAETGLDQEVVSAPLKEFVRYVLLHDRLNLIPQTPGKIIRAPLIPWRAKLRVLAELWQPPLDGEPTVAKWVQHRFGPALLPYVDAVYTGTYAGDFDRLTIDSVMPGVRLLEKQYGSILRGLFARLRARRKERGSGAALSMPAMTSFADGMTRLPEKLGEKLVEGHDLFLGTTVNHLARTSGGWRLDTDRGPFTAAHLVLATPINTALRLLGSFHDDLPLCQVDCAWLASVVLGFPDSVTLPPGFGYLAPEVEQRFALGALFTSNMFPGRAPAGHRVIEVLVGGRRHPERLELDDDTLAARALADVAAILHLPRRPAYCTVLRPEGGIPQLERHYPRLRRWRDSLLAGNHRLHLCGFGWDGIGINDMVKHACQVAEAIAGGADKDNASPEVKAIYF
jgi:oxygen-dependent protoporphyrinogen oxidase